MEAIENYVGWTVLTAFGLGYCTGVKDGMLEIEGLEQPVVAPSMRFRQGNWTA